MMADLPGWNCACGKNKRPSAHLCSACIATIQAQLDGVKNDTQ